MSDSHHPFLLSLKSSFWFYYRSFPSLSFHLHFSSALPIWFFACFSVHNPPHHTVVFLFHLLFASSHDSLLPLLSCSNIILFFISPSLTPLFSSSPSSSIILCLSCYLYNLPSLKFFLLGQIIFYLILLSLSLSSFSPTSCGSHPF